MADSFSSTTIVVFSNEKFGNIRTAGTSEEPLFCATDVCKILCYTNSSKAIADHVEEEDITKRYTLTQGGNQLMTFINESGLYSLIFGSKMESAKEFKRWVTSEVLPSIRKTGSYGIPKSFAEALRLAADQQEKIEAQQKLLEQQKPKAKYFDDLVDRKLNINFRDTAKEIGLKQGDFINLLIQHKYVYRDAKNRLKPYSEHSELFHIKECTSGEKWAGNQTLITPKGRETFNLLFGKH